MFCKKLQIHSEPLARMRYRCYLKKRMQWKFYVNIGQYECLSEIHMRLDFLVFQKKMKNSSNTTYTCRRWKYTKERYCKWIVCASVYIEKKSEIFCKQTFWVLLCFHTKKNLSLRYGVNGIETDDSKANKMKQTKSKRKNSFDDKDVCELFFNTEQKATTRENETMSHH